MKYFCRNQFILQICKFNCDVKQYVCSNFLHYLMHKYNNYNKRVFRQYVFGYEFACVALFQIFFDKVDTCNLFGPYKLVHSVISTNKQQCKIRKIYLEVSLWCLLATCVFKFPLVLHAYGQKVQINGFSPVCVRIWYCMFCFVPEILGQKGHL